MPSNISNNNMVNRTNTVRPTNIIPPTPVINNNYLSVIPNSHLDNQLSYPNKQMAHYDNYSKSYVVSHKNFINLTNIKTWYIIPSKKETYLKKYYEINFLIEGEEIFLLFDKQI